jgi:hypothetical protein
MIGRLETAGCMTSVVRGQNSDHQTIHITFLLASHLTKPSHVAIARHGGADHSAAVAHNARVFLHTVNAPRVAKAVGMAVGRDDQVETASHNVLAQRLAEEASLLSVGQNAKAVHLMQCQSTAER